MSLAPDILPDNVKLELWLILISIRHKTPRMQQLAASIRKITLPDLSVTAFLANEEPN
jgi:hypothetical protein